MNTETETPAEYGSDKPVGWVVHDPKSLEAARGKIKTLYEALQSQAREIAQLRHEVEKYSSRYDLATLSIKNQQEKLAQMTAENAALESTIEGLELDIEGYQQKSQELKDESILSDIAFDDIETLTAENAALTSQRDVAYGLIKAAKCPCCDGGGAYYGNMGEVCQCQWCYEAGRIRGEK